MIRNAIAIAAAFFGICLFAIGCAAETMPAATTASPTFVPSATPATATATARPAATALAPSATPEPTPTATPAPTLAPLPTYTALPTYTPPPTYTPYPTATATPAPTDTPQPTNTRRPTNTPRPTPTPNPFGKWRQDEWQSRSGETYYEVYVPASNRSSSTRLRLVCTPDDYTVVNMNWGSSTVIAQGSEVKDEAGETWATAHAVSVRFDDGEAQQETWWLLSDGNYSRPRQAYWRGAHPGFIQELRGVDTLTLWANTASGRIEAEFDVRNLDYALSQNPEHCREPDAYGKWVYDGWESDSGDTGYEFFLYAEGSDDIYLSVWCFENDSVKSVQFDWGKRRPSITADGYEIKQPDGTLHSTAHSVRVRYGDGVTQPESWQLFSAEITRRNRSLPAGYKGDAAGKIFQYQQVDTLTVWTDTDAGPIQVEFDVRRLDKALARLDRHCQ